MIERPPDTFGTRTASRFSPLRCSMFIGTISPMPQSEANGQAFNWVLGNVMKLVEGLQTFAGLGKHRGSRINEAASRLDEGEYIGIRIPPATDPYCFHRAT